MNLQNMAPNAKRSLLITVVFGAAAVCIYLFAVVPSEGELVRAKTELGEVQTRHEMMMRNLSGADKVKERLEGLNAGLEEFRSAVLPPFNQNSSAKAALIVTTYVKDNVGFNDGTPVNEIGNGWGAYDLGLHDAYLILAAKNAGYDTLIMGIRDGDAIRARLGIPENEEIMSVIAIGKAAEEPAPRPRKELDEVVKFF